MNSILLATDGSPSARNAARVAIELAADTGWHLKIVSVWSFRTVIYGEIPASAWTQIEEIERAHAHKVVAAALEEARTNGLEADGAVLQGDAAAEICDAARDATILVVGSHGWGSVKRLMFGSVSNAVLHHAPCPVLVVRGEEDDTARPEAAGASTTRTGETR